MVSKESRTSRGRIDIPLFLHLLFSKYSDSNATLSLDVILCLDRGLHLEWGCRHEHTMLHIATPELDGLSHYLNR